MASGTKYDYETLRYQYITTDISLSALSEEHSVHKSALVQYARRHGWDDQRENYRVLENDKALDRISDRRIKKVADIEADAFDTIHAAILKFAVSLEDRWVTDKASGERVFVPGQQVTPEGLTKLMDKYLVMTGNVTDRRANLGLTVDVGGNGNNSGLPREVLRELRDLAVTKGAGEQSMGQSPIPRIEGAKQVN